MNTHVSHRKRLLAVGAAVCCSPLFIMPAAQAATPFDPSSALTTSFNSSTSVSPSATCTKSDSSITGTPTTQPLEAGKAPLAASSTAQATGTLTADTTDHVSQSTTVDGRAWLRTDGSNPAAIDVIATGSSTSTASKPSSACTVSTMPGVAAMTMFTVTRPTVITVTAQTRGIGGYIWAISPGSLGGLADHGDGVGVSVAQSSRTQTTMWVPAGSYTGIAGAFMSGQSNKTAHATGVVSLHVAFAAAGSRTAAARAGYVLMPASRNCALHQVSPRITTSSKKAKQIKTVTFLIDGKVVRRISHPAKGTTVKLHATDDGPITVTAKVKLRNGKTITSTASYLQCS